MTRSRPSVAVAEPAAAPATAGTSQRPALVVRVRRVPGVPVVSVRVVLPGGGRLETVPGQAWVAGRMLAEGTRRRDWRRIAEDLEDRGMILATGGTFEAVGLSLDALAGDWERALAWAAELALEPSFPEDRCAWVRRQTAAELESLGDQPEVRTAWTFNEQLYTPHPRSRRLQGDAASLAALTAADCAALHAGSVGRGAVVTVAGEVDEEAVAARVEGLFGGVGAGGGAAPEPPAPAGGEARRRVELRGADQAQLYLGHLTVPRAHPDLAALELLAVILGAGSGLTGRIPTRIREQEGLAYAASAQTVAGAGLDAGRLVAYLATSTATVEQAERGVVEELRRLLADGVGEEELAEARGYLLGREPFRRETARQWADLLAEAAFYGLPVDDPEWRRQALEAPDRAAVEAAARRHLRPDALKVTIGLPRGS
jgi:zinc protease